MNSKAQIKGKLAHVLQINVCCLPFAVCRLLFAVCRLPFAVNVTLDLFIGGYLPRNINKQISLFALKRECDHVSSHQSDSGTI